MLLLCVRLVASHVQLFATPWTVARQAPLSMGILQARVLEWIAVPFSRGSSQLRNQTRVSCLQADFLPAELPGKLYINNRILFSHKKEHI